MRATIFSLPGLLLFPCHFGAGFLRQAPSTPARVIVVTVALRQSGNSNGAGNGDEASFSSSSSSFGSVEEARQRLESLVNGGGSSSGNTSPGAAAPSKPPSASSISPALHDESVRVLLPPPPPLTGAERNRRHAEMDLLRRLNTDDVALTDLWDSWFQERGPAAAAQLAAAEHWTGRGPATWPRAERVLHGLIRRHGVYWAEPLNRLATLYFLQGRWEESEMLCQMVLDVKPWHFGALSGLVMVYASMHEAVQARQWASRRLPPLTAAGSNRRRKQWVDMAVQDAQAALQDREDGMREWMGPPDDYESLRDAWQ